MTHAKKTLFFVVTFAVFAALSVWTYALLNSEEEATPASRSVAVNPGSEMSTVSVASASRALAATVTYPTPGQVKTGPDQAGDVMLTLPTSPVAAGDHFTVPVTVNCGSAVLGAIELQVHYDSKALEFVKVTGALSRNLEQPVATNLVKDGQLLIADFNTPMSVGDEITWKQVTETTKLYELEFAVRSDAASGTLATIGGATTELTSTATKEIRKTPGALAVAINTKHVTVR